MLIVLLNIARIVLILQLVINVQMDTSSINILQNVFQYLITVLLAMWISQII